jgi:hypothetical protein
VESTLQNHAGRWAPPCRFRRCVVGLRQAVRLYDDGSRDHPQLRHSPWKKLGVHCNAEGKEPLEVGAEIGVTVKPNASADNSFCVVLPPFASCRRVLSLKLLKNITRKYHLTAIDLFGYPPKRLEIFTSRENNLLIVTLRLGCALQQALETDL